MTSIGNSRGKCQIKENTSKTRHLVPINKRATCLGSELPYILTTSQKQKIETSYQNCPSEIINRAEKILKGM